MIVKIRTNIKNFIELIEITRDATLSFHYKQTIRQTLFSLFGQKHEMNTKQ